MTNMLVLREIYLTNVLTYRIDSNISSEMDAGRGLGDLVDIVDAGYLKAG